MNHSALCHTPLIITTFSHLKQQNTLFTVTFEEKIAESSQLTFPQTIFSLVSFILVCIVDVSEW